MARRRKTRDIPANTELKERQARGTRTSLGIVPPACSGLSTHNPRPELVPEIGVSNLDQSFGTGLK